MLSPRVLFLCTGNSARSQMAEALLRKHGGARFEAYSAGIEPSVINPFTVRALGEVGIDASGQWAKPLRFFLGKMHFDYVITVCSNAEERCPVFPGAAIRLHWPFEDPAAASGSDEEKLAKFRAVRDQIEARIQAWLKEIELVR